MADSDRIGSFPSIERQLGLPAGFLVQLLKEGDDWAFVIKAHALIEAATAHMLTAALGDSRLSDVVAWLELSGVRTGKLAFAETLELVGKPQRRFIRTLSELRNTLVHDVRNVGFTFEAYLAGRTPEQRKAFFEAFGGIFSKSQGPEADAFREIGRNSPRFLVWASTIIVVSGAYLTVVQTELDARKAAIEREAAVSDREVAAAAGRLLAAIEERVRTTGEFSVRAKPTKPSGASPDAT